MAKPHTPFTKSQIEAIQTVSPFTVTDPRQVRHVFTAQDPIGSAIFTACLNVVLCYNKFTENDSGWLVAGWIKESLSRALKEQPLLSGRLRRGEDGHGELEIVSNDSGLGLLEAKINMSVQEFVDLKDKEKAQSELVFWKDVDELNPQFSPLFYVQVTNFQCGGYSIGISCSILLADLLITDKIIQKWANIQKGMMLSNNDELKLPIFYLPSLKPTSFTLKDTFSSVSKETGCETTAFRVITETESVDLKEKLAVLCIEEAEKKNGNKGTVDEFTYVVKESSMVIRVEKCKKSEVGKPHLKSQVKTSSASLEDCLEMRELAFAEGNKPARVCAWIGPFRDGVVLEVPVVEEGACELSVIVSVPCQNES